MNPNHHSQGFFDHCYRHWDFFVSYPYSVKNKDMTVLKHIAKLNGYKLNVSEKSEYGHGTLRVLLFPNNGNPIEFYDAQIKYNILPQIIKRQHGITNWKFGQR